MNRLARALGILVLVGVALFLAMQLIRPSVLNSNPPVVSEPTWGSLQAEEAGPSGVLRLPQQRDPLAVVRTDRAVVGVGGL
jgi:hypothetical protein